MTKKNELALSGKEFGNQLIPSLFTDVDFESLNTVIDNMGNASGTLSEEEKEMARGIIEEWNYGVTQKLRDKAAEAHQFIQFFDASSIMLNIGHLTLDEFGDDVAQKTNTVDLYKEVLKTEEAVRAHRLLEPEDEEDDPNKSVAENIKRQSEHHAAETVWRLQYNKLRRAHALAIGKWKREMSQHETIKDLLAQSRKMSRGYGKMTDTATEKAQMAKLSISIADAGARDALKELLKFSTTI